LADRHDIDEKKLRYVLPLSQEYHVEIVRQIITFGLSSKQVKELCEGDTEDMNDNDPFDKLPPSAVKMAKVTQSTNTTTPQDLAKAILRQEGNPDIARARLQALKKLLSEAELYLERE